MNLEFGLLNGKAQKMTLWFASGNAHKKQELEALFPGRRIRIPAEAGLPFDPEETGDSFRENALLKARALHRLLGMGAGPGMEAGLGMEAGPVIADDSGLCVDALGGRPGIYSARYGEGRLSPAERNALLLEELGDNPRRSARFVCAMVLFFAEDRFILVQETLEGELVREARGAGGFGYDPLLYLPEYRATVAELPEGEKNRISHRGKAARSILRFLEGL
jgi:XTP/dITP diphosphohydrolase